MATSREVCNVVTTPHRHLDRIWRFAIALAINVTAASVPSLAVGQAIAGPLASREDLNAAANQAEQARNPLLAAAILQRLRDGDFQVGDRVVLTVLSETRQTDTLIVQAGRLLDLPGKSVLPLSGVLRSELKERVTAEVLKYVKAQDVDVTPLTRIAVLGEVTRPGYFALRSDVPITDAIMSAGGPTTTADIERTVVRRASRQYRSADETRQAISRGLTLDQFGLSAGDELVVGRQRQVITPTILTVVGTVTSLAAVIFAIRR
jgi:protein involved in polysaccharide export with SLBB domain